MIGPPQRCVKFRKRLDLGRGLDTKISLTENQRKVLAPCQLIGEGNWTVACTRPDGRVAKLTVDAVGTGNLIKAQGTRAVPKIYKAFRLKNVRCGGDTVYALIMERLTPLRRQRDRKEIVALNAISGAINNGRDPQAVDLKWQCSGDRVCTRFGKEVLARLRTLRDAGIEVRDLHRGNVGFDKRGRVKIIDLGPNAGNPMAGPRWLEGLEELADAPMPSMRSRSGKKRKGSS